MYPSGASNFPYSSNEDLKKRMPSTNNFPNKSNPPSRRQYEPIDQRAALFASLPKGNNRDIIGHQTSSHPSHSGYHTSSLMEAENDEMFVDLEAKVQDLKDISLRMRDETKESNTLLGEMSTTFVNVGGMMGSALNRLKALGAFRSGRHIWYMMLFFVGVLFLLYLFFSKR